MVLVNAALMQGYSVGEAMLAVRWDSMVLGVGSIYAGRLLIWMNVN